ncbi:MAG: PAS domain-containing protein, partial [Pseudomonadota bacterium]|nr:PAS domain-containing protein [Pseudomonadota bacterium]
MVNIDYPRRVLDNLTTGAIVLNRYLRVVFMSSGAEMLFGISFRQALGTVFQDLAGGAVALVDGMRRCLKSGHPYTER